MSNSLEWIENKLYTRLYDKKNYLRVGHNRTTICVRQQRCAFNRICGFYLPDRMLYTIVPYCPVRGQTRLCRAGNRRVIPRTIFAEAQQTWRHARLQESRQNTRRRGDTYVGGRFGLQRDPFPRIDGISETSKWHYYRGPGMG